MRTTTRRRRFVDDDSPYDADGVLKDGRSVRFSLLDSQAARANTEAARITEAKVATAVALTKEVMRADGSPNTNTGVDWRRFDDIDLSSHRPGYRVAAVDSNGTSGDLGPGLGASVDEWARHYGRQRRTQAGEINEESNDSMSASEIARAQMIADACSAWKRPPVMDALDEVPPGEPIRRIQ
jgi:hypothetical protein